MSATRLRKSWLSPDTGTVLLIMLACASLVGLDLRQCWVSHETRLDSVKAETANLAHSIAGHVHDTFTITETVLIGLRERVAIDGIGPAAIARLEQLMRLRVTGQQLFRGLFLIDEHGAWLANSAPGASHDVNYSERDYFRYHRDSTDERVHIGPPVRSKLDGTWIVTITHRINHPDGSFAGVLSATIATEVFQSDFRSFDIGKLGVITLMTDSSHLIVARQPFIEANVGRDVSNAQVLSFVDTALSKKVEYVGLVDGLTRIGSYHRVPGFDLLVLVSRERNEVLADWLRETQVHLAWMGSALLALAALGWRRVMWKRTNARTEALYRLLADNSSDAIICTGQDGRRRYVSPSFWAMTGWTEADLLGKRWSEIVVAEDRPQAAAVFREMMAGSDEGAAIFRYLCRDGTSVWVELRARQTADPWGGLPIFVANVRNISAQKAAEGKLAATYAELAAMNLTDPLTGIGNRRQFDEALRREWNRAMRDGSDLALMMVDADHFKAYNDLYGHPQGDVCLRLIAHTLATGVRRPGDLAARYGGEEFAVLMPGTSAQAGEAVANLMRRALLDQAMEHHGNEPGVVTVSIGVAALMPQRGSEPESLIRLADGALYEAKRTGRNRIAVAHVAPASVLLLTEPASA